ncbi:MAG: hypothetical protein HUU21_34800 [Polyangiaceae bacterium]|nr:hypothetical protein [Polyangiaceae bacterium]NUQ78725.1 hypothetical protein [Polyangiaceae bacterium]
MNRIDDPQLAFYLRHKAQIDEWAALAPRAPSVADQFFTSIGDDLDGLASELDPRAEPFRALSGKLYSGGSYPKLFLVDPAWRRVPTKKQDAEDLLLGIGLEWNRGKTDFTTPQRCAYIGVWYNLDLVGEVKQKELKKAVAEAGKAAGQKFSTKWYWLAYREEPASGEYWGDLSPYRQQIANSIRWMWKTFAPALRSTIGRT